MAASPAARAPFNSQSTTVNPLTQSMTSAHPTAPPFQNPIMKPAVHLPKHTLLESPNSRSIVIDKWRITARTNPISNSSECDELQTELSKDGITLPLPEMTFGNNMLRLEYRADGKFESKSSDADSDVEDENKEKRAESKADTWIYQFDTLSALLGVKRGEMEPGDGGVKVNYAEEWLKSRTGPTPLLPMPKTVPTKPYDWTYTTTYAGHEIFSRRSSRDISSPFASMSLSSSNSTSSVSVSTSSVPTSVPGTSSSETWSPSTHRTETIPLSELTRPDPILFYAEIPLFEDELHDNGSSAFVVRIRVMPTCIFILSRFTLRVDGVLFRTFDTRIYSSLEYADRGESTPMLIRETSGWEAPYESVKVRLPKHDDLTPLTDPGFIAKILSESSQSQTTGAGTGWRGLGKKCEWMRVPGTS